MADRHCYIRTDWVIEVHKRFYACSLCVCLCVFHIICPKRIVRLIKVRPTKSYYFCMYLSLQALWRVCAYTHKNCFLCVYHYSSWNISIQKWAYLKIIVNFFQYPEKIMSTTKTEESYLNFYVKFVCCICINKYVIYMRFYWSNLIWSLYFWVYIVWILSLITSVKSKWGKHTKCTSYSHKTSRT